MKKSKSIREEAQKQKEEITLAIKKQQEIEKLVLIAEKEEADHLLEVEAKINAIADENDLYCGIILDHANILNIIELALQTHENIKIPFKLYEKI